MQTKGQKVHTVGLRLLILGAVVAALIYLFWLPTENLVNNATETISTQYSQEMNAQITAHITTTLEYYFEELDILQNSLSLINDLTPEKLKHYIREAESNSAISYLVFADEDGYVYDRDGAYLGTLKIHWLGKLLSGEKRIVSDNETIGQDSYILMGTSFDDPIPMGGKKLCAAIFGITNDELSQRIVLTSEYSGGYASIINKEGGYIIKNPNEYFSGLNAFSILSQKDHIPDDEMNALRAAVNGGKTHSLSVSGAGEKLAAYLYFAPVPGTDWYLINCLPGSFIRSSIEDLQSGLGNFTVAVAVLILFSAMVIIAVLVTSTRQLRESQQELAAALEAAEAASHAKTTFLSNMSHDIRTPLNAILGYTDIVSRHYDDREKSQDALGKIKTSSDHLLRLINDILEMSRIEAGRLELQNAPMDIRAAIAGVEHMSQALAAPRNIDFFVEIGALRTPYIYADELHVNEVLVNIISNAVKYTNPGGKVIYRINQLENDPDGRVRFRFAIIDNGIGMSEEYQTHLFEAFTRENSSTVSKIEGAGLGLSIVKRIVDLAGGSISVNSKLGVGSTFEVTLPFQAMDDQAIAEFEKAKELEEHVTEDISLTGKRVLLVDDNELNREIAMEILALAELTVETAEDGQVAVQRFTQKGAGYYDLILMDIQMPIMDGYEATRAIRQLPGGDTLPIIAVSANAFEEDRKKSLAAGMNAHIAKPIDVKELLETMQRLA